MEKTGHHGGPWPAGSIDDLTEDHADAHRARPKSTLSKALLGITAAAVAIALRLAISSDTGGDQAIFTFPAVVAATLLFGVRAGAATAVSCISALWYFVLPPVHSFALAGLSEGIALLVYAFVAAVLIWAIGAMRLALGQYRRLADQLELLVDRRTGERNRVWERSQELVAIVRRDGVIAAMNPAMRSKAALSNGSPLPTFSSLILEEDRPSFEEARRALEKGAPGAGFEAQLRDTDGPSWIEWSATSDGDRLYIVGRDFTAERECADRLQQSRKMEFVGQMTGGLVHDFANLLSPITMVLDLLRIRHAEDGRTTGLIASANESTQRAELLVRRLLRFARSERLPVRRMPAGPMIEQIAPLLRQVIGQRTLDVAIDENLPEIAVDPNELDMALLNLAVNARDATPGGGTIRLTARNAGEGWIAITVEDDGEGMDAATLERACEPFFSTKGPDRGTGLGLPMVHNFVVGAGGSFKLDSILHEGTTAQIRLPVATSADGAAGADQASAP